MIPRVRALILQPIHYNTQFFNAIADSGLVTLEVFYLLRRVDSANQFFAGQLKEHFVSHHLEFRQLRGFPMGWNTSLVADDHWDAFWSGGYYYPPILGANLQLGRQHRPWMVWSDTPQLDGPTNFGKKVLKNAILSWTFAHATLVLSTGLQGTQAIKSLGAPAKKVRSLPYYIDQRLAQTTIETERAEIQRLRSKLVDDATPLILFVGQLIDRKGVDVLLEAAMRLAQTNLQFHLVLVGEGPLRLDVEEAVRTITPPARITAMGFCDPDEVRRLMAASDVFVLPSRFDAYPLVALEAQACALPVVISSACGVVPERVTDGVEGFVVTPGDVVSLTVALERLCRDRELRECMRQAALKRADEHSIQAGVSKFVELLHEALDHVR